VSTSIVLGFGPQPVDFFGKANKLCGKDAVLDTDVARMAGANFAIGMPEDLARLRKLLEAGAVHQTEQANPGLSEAATRWLASGERGLSSNTIFTHLTGIDALHDSYKSHPYDPSDFRRCRLLLEQVPELVPLFPKMAEVSEQWKDLVYLWGDICKAMDEEAPKWRDGYRTPCPNTYSLIKRAIGR
jgi:hypothetical protein